MRKFLSRLSLFTLGLFGGMLALYAIIDPFMVIRRYDDYFNSGNIRSCPNDAFRAIRLMDQFADSLSYNSFIVGSSRSQFYYVDDWKQHLKDDAVCFHFNQSADNILSTIQKVNYLYKRFDRIDNLLLIMDHESLSYVSPERGPLRITPYQVTNYKNFLVFHWDFFRAFYTLKFWTDKRLKEPGLYNPQYNEHYLPKEDLAIENNNENYYESLADFAKLYPRENVELIGEPVISSKRRKLLEDFASLLNNHNETDYRIIISPLYDQVKLNPIDSLILVQCFGGDRVYDFSGKNEFTDDILNYYENSHYRPCLCSQILDKVYETPILKGCSSTP